MLPAVLLLLARSYYPMAGLDVANGTITNCSVRVVRVRHRIDLWVRARVRALRARARARDGRAPRLLGPLR